LTKRGKIKKMPKCRGGHDWEHCDPQPVALPFFREFHAGTPAKQLCCVFRVEKKLTFW